MSQDSHHKDALADEGVWARRRITVYLCPATLPPVRNEAGDGHWELVASFLHAPQYIHCPQIGSSLRVRSITGSCPIKRPSSFPDRVFLYA